MISLGYRQWLSIRFQRSLFLTLLLLLFLCTSVRAQNNEWLPEHAKLTLDSIQTGFADWNKRSRRLHESNLIPAAERQLEEQQLTVKSGRLRQAVYRYIDGYGFPGRPTPSPEVQDAKSALLKKLFALPAADTLARQQLLKEVALLDTPSRERLRAQQAFITLLNLEPDFDLRCMMIPILRTEYENKTFDAHQMMLFLEQTYLILHNGDAFPFASGTRSAQKLSTYIAELDGCW